MRTEYTIALLGGLTILALAIVFIRLTRPPKRMYLDEPQITLENSEPRLEFPNRPIYPNKPLRFDDSELAAAGPRAGQVGPRRFSGGPDNLQQQRHDEGFDAAGLAFGLATGMPISPARGFSLEAAAGAMLHNSMETQSTPSPTVETVSTSSSVSSDTSASVSSDPSPSPSYDPGPSPSFDAPSAM
jgi:hypothetical protein